MKSVYVIALNSNIISYYDGGSDGDPSRTCLLKHAKIFKSFNAADKVKQSLIQKYPNREFHVISKIIPEGLL